MSSTTPLEALYALFKGEFGLNHRAFSQLILSDRPYQNGMSPQQMSMNTSWLSRSVVHAPIDSIQGRLFADFAASSRRVHARLNQSGRSDSQIFRAICDSSLMPEALSAADQSGLVYRNVLTRLATLPPDVEAVRARGALLLTITAGCTGSIARAVELTSSFVRSDGRASGSLTPQPTIMSAAQTKVIRTPDDPDSIALVRLVDGCVASNFYVVPSSVAGSVVGALALGEHAIADVDIDVSAEHLRVYRERGRWLVCDLGSKNGTTLIAAGGRVATLVPGVSVELHPGDTLRLGRSTTFVVVAAAKTIRGGVAEMTPSLAGPAALTLFWPPREEDA